MWDGDYLGLLVFGLLSVFSSEPTVWDGDLERLPASEAQFETFRAHCVGWRLLHQNFQTTSPSSGSEPTVWDGDATLLSKAISQSFGSKPTVWDGD